MSMSTILNGATVAQDADSATVFATILNNDLHAIKTLGGRNQFSNEDALRISRIWAEYQGMTKSPLTSRPPLPRATGASAAI